jgi:serine/threonine protein kinase/FtsH-binding integral membrane protein
MNKSCPTENIWTDYIGGSLQQQEMDELKDHLSACTECRKVFDRLKQDETLAQKLRRATGLEELIELRKRVQASAAGDYEIIEQTGSGAGGIIFKARDVRLNRMVALKCPTNPNQRERLLKAFEEARTMAQISHPHIAEIYRLCDTGEVPFMVMEYVEGSAIFDATENLSLNGILDIFEQVLQAVKELHKHNIVHRDLKPGNIMVNTSGSVKVLDLGIAEQHFDISSPVANASNAVGTPAYMAPEQIAGNPSGPAMDVFALGIILFELLTGQRPFGGATVQEVIRTIQETQPPLLRSLNTKIPGSLQAICLKALEKDPTRRFQNAQEFLLDIQRFRQGEPIAANPTLLNNILEHGVEKHLQELARWQEDHLISMREYDFLAGKYEALHQREEIWVLDSRRISFSQVVLHLGAWACVVSVLLMLCFNWEQLQKWQRIFSPGAIFTLLTCLGSFLWQRRTRRVALVLLMAAALSCPLVAATTMVTMEWLTPESYRQTNEPGAHAASEDSVAEETAQEPVKNLLGDFLSNYQLLIATGCWFLVSLAMWFRTKTAAFSLISTLSILALATAVFALLDLRGYLERQELDKVAIGYLIPTLVLFIMALTLDLRFRAAPLAAATYIISIICFLLSLTLIAAYGPTTDWLGMSRWIPDILDEIAYSFIINGAIYFTFGLLTDRSKRSRWLRRLAPVFFWLTPTHLLAPIVYFMEQEKWSWSLLPADWTLAELVLPIGALFFVFASVPKQMKSFFFSGLFYVAVALVWLTHQHFQEKVAWPISLAGIGIILAVIAWRKPILFDKNKKTLIGKSW